MLMQVFSWWRFLYAGIYGFWDLIFCVFQQKMCKSMGTRMNFLTFVVRS